MESSFLEEAIRGENPEDEVFKHYYDSEYLSVGQAKTLVKKLPRS
jgi:hypothetical protein